jgi:hypothetical protein
MSSLPYKISSKSTYRFKGIKRHICTHLRNLNVRNFGMAETTRLKNVMWWSSSMASPASKLHEYPPTGSKVISGGHTETHTDRLVI